MGKIKSVLELSRYKLNDSAYWVVFRRKPDDGPLGFRPKNVLTSVVRSEIKGISTDDLLYKLAENHPKEIHKGPPRCLPHLNHADFNNFANLINSEIIVEEFVIAEIRRSINTGEFLYMNKLGEWMPEIYLFDTAMAARDEKKRLLKKIHSWIKSNA